MAVEFFPDLAPVLSETDEESSIGSREGRANVPERSSARRQASGSDKGASILSLQHEFLLILYNHIQPILGFLKWPFFVFVVNLFVLEAFHIDTNHPAWKCSLSSLWIATSCLSFLAARLVENELQDSGEDAEKGDSRNQPSSINRKTDTHIVTRVYYPTEVLQDDTRFKYQHFYERMMGKIDTLLANGNEPAWVNWNMGILVHVCYMLWTVSFAAGVFEGTRAAITLFTIRPDRTISSLPILLASVTLGLGGWWLLQHKRLASGAVPIVGALFIILRSSLHSDFFDLCFSGIETLPS